MRFIKIINNYGFSLHQWQRGKPAVSLINPQRFQTIEDKEIAKELQKVILSTQVG